MKILLVEDDSQVASVLKALLEEECTIQHAMTLQDALTKISLDLPDVLLLDLTLPDSSGVATVERVRKHAPNLPIVVLTGDEHDETAVASLKAGAQEYLTKTGLEHADLQRAIRYATERVELLGELQASRDRYSLVLEATNAGVWDWNRITGESHLSPRWKKMLGYEPDEISDSTNEWYDRIHPDDYERVIKVEEEYMNGNSATIQIEHRLRHKDGSYRWVVTRGVGVRDSDGTVLRMVGSHEDITERKEREQKLSEANAALNSANEALRNTQMRLIQAEKMQSMGRLAAGIAHEVKNPLATILMGVEFMQQVAPKIEMDLSPVLSEMSSAAERADGIIRGLLEYTAPLEMNFELEDPNDVLEQALLFVKHEIDSAQILVDKKFAQGLPKIDLDRGKMIQVLVNLITNAVHAMKEGGTLTVSTYLEVMDSLEEDSAQTIDVPQVVVIKVQDEGEGIEEHNLEKIYDIFFTTKPPGEGTGLGLAVSKSIIDLHGAGLTIRNREDGRGAEALITFLP